MVFPAYSAEGGRTHLGFFDSKRGSWALDGYPVFHYGVPKDHPLLCDWNGDGLDTVGLYRETSGYLYLRNSNGFGFADVSAYYGIPGDKPVCGDWDGDGADTIGVYRASNSTFYLRNSNTQGFADIEFTFGDGQGEPIAGDWDGGGRDTVGLWRPWNGRLQLASGHTSEMADVQRWLGGAGDQLVTGDWDGDGRDTVGTYRRSDGWVHLTNIGELPGSPLDYWTGNRAGIAVAGVTGEGLEALPTSGWRVQYVDSEETSGEVAPGANAFDGDIGTNWHTQWQGATPGYPHQLQIDMGSSHHLTGFSYTPRQGAEDNGRISDYEVYLSNDPGNWGSPVVTGHFPNTSNVLTIGFAPREARYVRVVALSEVGGGPWAAIAEFSLLSDDASGAAPPPDPPPPNPPPPPAPDPPPPDPPPPPNPPHDPPPGSISVWPGENIQAVSDSAGAGATLYIRAGVHRMQQVKTKDNQTFIGEPGAVLNGSRLLSGWQQDGSRWWVGGQTQQGNRHGRCEGGSPRCNYPEDLFIDSVRQEHVDSLSKVAPGKWYFDYGADRVYVGDNPGGRQIEVSVTERAFYGQTNNVTISGFTVEKYANPAQHGAIDSRNDNRDSTSGSNWLIIGNKVRLNHGVGIKAAHNARVVDNHIHSNGQLGIGVVGNNPLVEGNEIANNGLLGYEFDWERGGSKFAGTVGAVVRDNNVHDNIGRGLWADVNAYDTLFEGNVVVSNTHAGIFYEISYVATIRDNYIASNGYADQAWLWGGGIVIAGSPDVEIYNNTLVNNADGIAVLQQDRSSDAAQFGPHIIQNIYVHNNNITMTQGLNGVAQDMGDNAVFTSRNNRFADNVYDTGTGNFFEWDNRQLNLDGWQAYGQQ